VLLTFKAQTNID